MPALVEDVVRHTRRYRRSPRSWPCPSYSAARGIRSRSATSGAT